jgi:hypothetical protein
MVALSEFLWFLFLVEYGPKEAPFFSLASRADFPAVLLLFLHCNCSAFVATPNKIKLGIFELV